MVYDSPILSGLFLSINTHKEVGEGEVRAMSLWRVARRGVKRIFKKTRSVPDVFWKNVVLDTVNSMEQELERVEDKLKNTEMSIKEADHINQTSDGKS